MMRGNKTPDGDVRRGISQALHRVYNGVLAEPPIHIAADAQAAEFDALRNQLDNPPPQYRRDAN
jgi:hypothetical protein